MRLSRHDCPLSLFVNLHRVCFSFFSVPFLFCGQKATDQEWQYGFASVEVGSNLCFMVFSRELLLTTNVHVSCPNYMIGQLTKTFLNI